MTLATASRAPAAVRLDDLPPRYIDVNGFRVHYRVAGDGLPVVLVHGESASVQDWRWVLPSLSDILRVHVLDLPGHGDTSKPPAPYSAELLADTLVAFLEALDLEEAVLIGHSLGGLLAARAARRLGGLPRALCLIDSGGLGRYVHPANVMEALPGVGEMGGLVARTPAGRWHHAWLRAGLVFARWWEAPPEWLAEQRRLVTLDGFNEASLAVDRSVTDLWGQRESILGDLAGLDVPTLIVWGALDAIVPVWHGLAAASVLRDGQLRVIPGCGHMPHIEEPAKVVDALRRFLS